jgi:hypothetical protein
MTPEQVLEALVYELYEPVSALGSQVDRLSTGAFADEELGDLLAQIRDRVDDLSRVVVILKRYNDEHHAPEARSRETGAGGQGSA